MGGQERRQEDFEAFSERNGVLHVELDRKISAVQLKVEGLSEDAVLSADEDKYLDDLVQDYLIEMPELRYDEVTCDRREVTVKKPGLERYRGILPDSHLEGKVQAYRFYIPYSGSIGYLKYAPIPGFAWTRPVSTDGSQLSFEVVADGMDSERVNQEQKWVEENLKAQLDNMNGQIAGYNSSLRDQAKRAFDSRKARAQRNRDLDGGIKVPPRR